MRRTVPELNHGLLNQPSRKPEHDDYGPKAAKRQPQRGPWFAVGDGRGLKCLSVISHYHEQRNHQSLDNSIILPSDEVGRGEGEIVCRESLGSMLDYYYPYMLEMYGESGIEELRQLSKTTKHFTASDYLALEQEYKEKLKCLGHQ